MKLYFFIIFTFGSVIISAQNTWNKAYSNLLEIDTVNNEIKFLHFKIKTQPEYYYYSRPYLTDVYYSVEYKEFGTPETFECVELYDGHLINDIEKKYSKQWQGPFIGNRDISYKFLFELESKNQNILSLTIFSTNPEMDLRYCNVDPNFPFQVNAVYRADNLIKAIDIYSNVSTINAIYSIARSTNIALTIGTAVLEDIIVYAIQSKLSNLPIYLTIKCNVCGHSETIIINSLNYSEIYTCKTNGCHNSAKIFMTD